MFGLSFALLFYLKDYSLILEGSDLYWHIFTFQTIDDLSWSEIVYRFVGSPHSNEPFFWLYVKISRILVFGNADYYVLFQYFTMITLVAYLGKIVNDNKFVIIILCMMLLNFAILFNVFQLWRHSMASLIFIIGIFSFYAGEKNWIPRIIIYSSMLFHIIVT